MGAQKGVVSWKQRHQDFLDGTLLWGYEFFSKQYFGKVPIKRNVQFRI